MAGMNIALLIIGGTYSNAHLDYAGGNWVFHAIRASQYSR